MKIPQKVLHLTAIRLGIYFVWSESRTFFEIKASSEYSVLLISCIKHRSESFFFLNNVDDSVCFNQK